MSYEITRREDLGALQLTHTGLADIDELTTAREKVIGDLQRQGCGRLLVDVRRVEHELGMQDHFEFTAAHASLLPPGLRVAVVVRPDFPHIAQFIENVAVNRGVVLSVFEEAQDAEHWLKTMSRH
ncbi:MAG: hypothetical protein REI12_07305 [Pedobacter sp.]|nr:hypothetical protein [Pedobacter sp.]